MGTEFHTGLTIHQKLFVAFSLSAVLLGIGGYISFANHSLPVTVAVTAASIAVVMAVGFFIYRSITVPINCIQSAVGEIAKGNFDVRFEKNMKNDELGQLARHIEQMKNELKDKDRIKDEFISIASHELRTPIQPIISYAELARRGVIRQDQAWEVITQQTRRLKQLADDILDVSRIEGRRLALKKEYFSVNEVIEKIIDVEKVRLADGVSMRLLAAPSGSSGGSDYRIYADRSRLTQVISNLTGNAAKFTKTGSIEVRVGAVDGGSHLQILVSDTGPGIPDEMFPLLFSKFATRSVASGSEHGTGLGLFICKGIVQAHGGSIEGFNNEKGGATFRIILPAGSGKEEKGEGVDSSQKTSLGASNAADGGGITGSKAASAQ